MVEVTGEVNVGKWKTKERETFDRLLCCRGLKLIILCCSKGLAVTCLFNNCAKAVFISGLGGTFKQSKQSSDTVA